ncbi:TPA: hypothetical protein ACNCDQ_004900, partial [Escherichia coli]
FSIFLMQQGAAANLIRIAVENILTSMGIPTQNDKGKTIRVSRYGKILLMSTSVFRGDYR